MFDLGGSSNETLTDAKVNGTLDDNDSTPTAPTATGELVLRPPIIRTSSSSEMLHDSSQDELSVSIESIESTKESRFTLSIAPARDEKRLRSVQSVPYFTVRPASENDIFMIAGTSMSRISMTPEVPAISFTTLPKNYEDTPTIEKYKEAISLHSIQTNERANEPDYSMPRYFGVKSDLFAQSADNLAKTQTTPKKIEKSKRLKVLRANLPPLSIHINKEKSRERNIE